MTRCLISLLATAAAAALPAMASQTVRFDYTGTTQSFTSASQTKAYIISAYGASGGTGRNALVGGRGALITARYVLPANTSLFLVVGGSGTEGNNVGGGGGGSFVYGATPLHGTQLPLLLVAGGGGGAGWNGDGCDASATRAGGRSCFAAFPGNQDTMTKGGAGGTGGSGGFAAMDFSFIKEGGGGGAGWSGDGQRAANFPAQFVADAQRWTNGGVSWPGFAGGIGKSNLPGIIPNNGSGGFGGGGAASGLGGGGGGGYSGGGGGCADSFFGRGCGGGGGGSYIADAAIVIEAIPGLRVGDGVIEISTVPEPASWALLIAGFGLVGAVARRRLPLPQG